MRPQDLTAHNQITLLYRGEEFFPALIAAMDAARFEIYLETYIFAFDTTGRAVVEALMRAADRGVVVKVVTDWIGTGRKESQRLHLLLEQANISHRSFNPWFRRGVARTHRKIGIVDRRHAFIGGININDDMISDDGFDRPLPYPRWDFAVRVEGPLVAAIHDEAQSQWKLLTGLHLRYRFEKLLERRTPHHYLHDGTLYASFVVRDNLRNRHTIEKAFLKAIGSARKSVLLANPYFAPGRKLRRGLEMAALRGIEVTLLLGVGHSSVQDAVAHSFYPKLLQGGVRVVEYRRTQLHGKVAVVDDTWATVGSSNWDGFSLFVNQEANIVVKDKKFAEALRLRIEDAMRDGTVVRMEDFVHIPWSHRAWYGFAYRFYKMVFRLITLGKYTG
jgi:cardiolipin synthase